jgi:type II secretory ATPase GspE/PulE/Tfp pilus assembly ATPase PilB-like protein
MVEMPYGLILVVGPTGSGKTTTLHAALGHINRPEKKIWTAEDPVEIVQEGLRQVQVKPGIGLTFARILRAFLRADPDIIMVGETRDEETANTVIEASLTGHLVFSTLHTNSAPETVTRLLGMGMDPYNFADALLCVLAQRLVKRLCAKCKTAYEPDREEIERILYEYGEHPSMPLTLEDLDGITLFKPNGCSLCNNTGYKGRMAIHELLLSDDGLRKLIQKRRPVMEIREHGLANGMLTLKQDGIKKVLMGDTDMKQVLAACIR